MVFSTLLCWSEKRQREGGEQKWRKSSCIVNVHGLMLGLLVFINPWINRQLIQNRCKCAIEEKTTQAVKATPHIN